MPQHEFIPQAYVLTEEGPSSLTLNSTDSGFRFAFEALRPGLFRTTFYSLTHPLPPHPSAFRPSQNLEGADPKLNTAGSQKRIVVGNITASVEWTGCPVVSLQLASQEKPIHRDLQFRSYVVDSTGIAHYTVYKRDTLHVGLGEKAAPMNLSNRHFILSATDCFGYDIYRTDPLYKHIPLLINATPNGCIAMFSTSHSRGTYSIGSEIDGLWGHFKVYRQDYGGLEEYLMVGKTIQDVVKIYAELVGFPRLVPRWAFGYIAGGMKYSMLDEPRASDALTSFAEKLKQHDIPCSAFQMSSGYTVAETDPKTRNVFTWNKHRFPDPAGFVAKYHSEGIRIIANVKPYVLASHPVYQKLLDANALLSDPRTGKSGIARLWSAGGGESGEGGHIDFTSKAGFSWWYNGVKALRGCGIEGIWNDNNEYTIPDDNWHCMLDRYKPSCSERLGKNIGLWGRALHTELMGQSSHDALVDLDPEIRPFVLTRSATAGTMRYAASSWGGDNVTSWDSMKGSNSLSLNAGMSLLQCYGHDIGGFEGPQPSPELLLRWVQLGAHSPRFAINCFKTDENDNTIGGVIEPWMYPEITPLIRDIIKRRYELIPYLYSLMLQSHMTAIAPQRWIGWGFENDAEVWTAEVMKGDTQYWLGDALLIGGVYEPALSSARLYLPTQGGQDQGYINLNAPYQHFAAGQWVGIESEWRKSIPLLARVGSAVVVGKDVQTRSPGDNRFPSANVFEDDHRAVEIFPPKNSTMRIFVNTWYEDDGISAKPDISMFTVSYSCTETEVTVMLERGKDNVYVPLWKQFNVILPVGDERTVVLSDMKGACEKLASSSSRRLYASGSNGLGWESYSCFDDRGLDNHLSEFGGLGQQDFPVTDFGRGFEGPFEGLVGYGNEWEFSQEGIYNLGFLAPGDQLPVPPMGSSGSSGTAVGNLDESLELPDHSAELIISTDNISSNANLQSNSPTSYPPSQPHALHLARPPPSKSPPPSRTQKRVLNTLAARRYRKKRVDQTLHLETTLKETETERDDLKIRVAKLEREVEVLRELLGK
ncbi:neutral alpha-glucosidase [Amylocarpus encephaloides]|uniref:alpha-glucosidase n=1 Tax=Amylocarpus encephaloides TaxID=45428 RepID=A0A9P7YBD4_9HELO|nr:neutral alpha-glucosidase [Amylocarpus encephaloides]